MRQHHHSRRLRLRYLLPAIGLLVILLYLVFAYNYFYFKQHRSHLPWPNNQHSYTFNDTSTSQITYAALGDSLTFGFGATDYKDGYTYQVARSLAADGKGVKMIDYSFPGDRIADTMDILDAVILSKPDVVTVLIGVNDTHRLVQSNEFAPDYELLLKRLSTETHAKIYAVSIPYLGGPSAVLPPFNYYYDAKIRNHNADIQELVQKYHVHYIDLYTPTVGQFKKDGPHYSKDAYHPSAAGYKIWADIITHDASF